MLQQPGLILDYLRQQAEGEGPELTDVQRELKRLQRQQATLGREEQRLIDAYQVGALEVDELKERRQRLREARQQIQQRAQVMVGQLAHAQHAARVTETVVAFCDRVKEQLVEPPFALK